MLRVNLFHELQRLEFERKYDPVRIAVYCFTFGLLVLGVWTALLYLGYRPSREAVEAMQKQLKTMDPQLKQAESKLAELPIYQSEIALLKKRAESKPLQSRNLEHFKSCMPSNLFVKKLSVLREVISEKVPGPKDKKGNPTFVVKTVGFNVMNFEATYSEPSKPKSLEQRDQLMEFFEQNEKLREMSVQVTEDGQLKNKVKLLSFSTTEPAGNEPAVGSLLISVELKP
jgi:hypothetical protein